MTLTAVLFAGGLSRRMGTDKATLTFGDQPLWAKQLGLLRELQPQTVLVSARTRPAWCPPEINVVTDQPPSRGPLSGLAAALQRLETSHLLALAIDLARMTAQPLHRLWGMTEAGRGVIPLNGDHFEPLCAIYPAEAAPIVESALGGADVSLQHLIRDLADRGLMRTWQLEEGERAFFHNVNTPADLAP